MPFEKHELTQKQQKKDWLKCWKEYIVHDFSQTVFILMKLYLELEKLSKENGEK